MNKEDKPVNPFELLHSKEEIPPGLKDEVMSTINLVHLAADIGKLFTVDMAKTASKLMDTDAEQKQNKKR